MKAYTLLATAASATLGGAAAAQTVAPVSAAPVQHWNADAAHSQVAFAVKHMMFATVRGRFTDFQAQIETDAATLVPRRITATIRAASLTTGVEKRDAHLGSPDFFDAARYPELRFVSTRITPLGEGRYTVEGNLTIRDVTRPVTLTLETTGKVYQDPWGTRRTGGVAEGTINRKDWGLTWNQALEAGGVLVGDEVTLTLEIEATPPATTGAGDGE